MNMTDRILRSAITINKITVVQSLGENDFKTGRKLYDDIDVLSIANNRGLEVEFVDADSKEKFIRCLDRLTAGAEQFRIIPLLHIEAHGRADKTGIVFANGDYLSWADIKPCLVKLNIATRHNLLVVLATCHGGYLTRALYPMERSPCWGLVGPTDVVRPGDLLSTFSRFYEALLMTGDGDQAVKVLNSTKAPGVIAYYFTTAERIFGLIYKNYIKEHCGDEMYQRRARYVRKAREKKGLEHVSVGQLKRRYRATERDYFERSRHFFFMLDLFPEVETRISITYDDVKS
jgi:hypothetical protein